MSDLCKFENLLMLKIWLKVGFEPIGGSSAVSKSHCSCRRSWRTRTRFWIRNRKALFFCKSCHYYFSCFNVLHNHERWIANRFPNIEIALRIFLSLFITNVPDERSFSKLKLIKNTLRNRMTDEKLNAFSLMSIENEILDSLNPDEIIQEFVMSKNRRKVY